MTDEPMTVQCCPYCEDTSINPRSGRWTDDRVQSVLKTWWCQNCQRAFDDPAKRRAQKRGHQRQGGLAQKLCEADPDEVRAGD